MSIPDDTLSRRHFLHRLGLWGAMGAMAPLAACGGGAASGRCMDVSGLTEQERRMRESLQYVDVSPLAGKTCSNCEFWEAVKPADACGGCKLVKGPIHPDGYCTSWVPQRVSA